MKRLAVGIVSLLALAVPAFACKCAPPPQDLNSRRAFAEWRLRNAEIVFEGKVEKIEVQGFPLKPEPGKTVTSKMGIRVSFSAVRSYRGSQREQFMVETGFGAGDCGYLFKTGESYLVHAWAESGRLSTSICSGTTELENAGAELRLLRGEPPTPDDLLEFGNQRNAREWRADDSDKICGKVSFPEGVKARSVTVWIFPEGDHPVSLFGDSVESGADGSFCFSWLEPGKYLIGASADGPRNSGIRYLSYFPGVLQRSRATRIDLKRGAGVARADFALAPQPQFTVSGYLRGVPRSMVDSIQVFLMSDKLDAFSVLEPVPLGPHGTFEIREVPVGHYTAFAVRENDDESFTYLSTVTDLDVQGNIGDLKLEFVAERK
jgi:hypothetical protein